jgi:hypothetical protein
MEEGVNLLLINGDGTIALACRYFFEEMTSVQRQGASVSLLR